MVNSQFENDNKWDKTLKVFPLTLLPRKEYTLYTRFNIDNYGRPLSFEKKKLSAGI